MATIESHANRLLNQQLQEQQQHQARQPQDSAPTADETFGAGESLPLRALSVCLLNGGVVCM